jgi:3-oxoadipate enol-lactonase
MDNRNYRLSDKNIGHPVLVLGNSLGTRFSLWDQVSESLSRHFCLLYYNPHPRPETGNPTIASRGNELLQLFDHLGLERADFCGVSMSGLLGQWLALEAPNRIRNLVLSNTAARIGNSEGWEQRITLIRAKSLAKVAASLANRWFSPVFAAQNPEVIERFASQLGDYSTEEYLAGCEALRDTDFRDRVARIRTRTLIIAGSNDPATSVTDAKLLHQQIRSSQLLVLPCAHLACVEAPEAFAGAVLDFLLEDR